MTQYYYGTHLEKAIEIARNGVILSPLLEQRAWLNDVRRKDPEYYAELVGSANPEAVARQLVSTESPRLAETMDSVILVNRRSLALLQATKAPKLVLRLDMERGNGPFLQVPGKLFLRGNLACVGLDESALEHKVAIYRAFKDYTDCYELIRKV